MEENSNQEGAMEVSWPEFITTAQFISQKFTVKHNHIFCWFQVQNNRENNYQPKPVGCFNSESLAQNRFTDLYLAIFLKISSGLAKNIILAFLCHQVTNASYKFSLFESPTSCSRLHLDCMIMKTITTTRNCCCCPVHAHGNSGNSIKEHYEHTKTVPGF